MKNEQILKKAIEKAMSNGYKNDSVIKHDGSIEWLKRDETISESSMGCQISLNLYTRIIFSHSFAKAFWGKGKPDTRTGEELWQYNLQQMVLEEEPLKYLQKFL